MVLICSTSCRRKSGIAYPPWYYLMPMDESFW
jgi:hypothetical protein